MVRVQYLDASRYLAATTRMRLIYIKFVSVQNQFASTFEPALPRTFSYPSRLCEPQLPNSFFPFSNDLPQDASLYAIVDSLVTNERPPTSSARFVTRVRSFGN